MKPGARFLVFLAFCSVVALLSEVVGSDVPTAHASGGHPSLSVPPDWPATIPVPAGQITGIHRTATTITLDIIAPGVTGVVIPSVDALYQAAAFALHPDSHNPRYLARIDNIVTVYFRAHDFQIGDTDLVITENPTGVSGVNDGPAQALSLGAVYPNPSRGDRLALTVALPVAAPALLELFDVSGRRLRVRQLGSLGAGRHLVDMASGPRLSPGLYLLRLTQGLNTRVTRVAVIP